LACGRVGSVDLRDLGLNFNHFSDGRHFQLCRNARGLSNVDQDAGELRGGKSGGTNLHGIAADRQESRVEVAAGIGRQMALRLAGRLANDIHFGAGKNSSQGILNRTGYGSSCAALCQDETAEQAMNTPTATECRMLNMSVTSRNFV
jgi:hypothetical protein